MARLYAHESGAGAEDRTKTSTSPNLFPHTADVVYLDKPGSRTTVRPVSREICAASVTRSGDDHHNGERFQNVGSTGERVDKDMGGGKDIESGCTQWAG
ncbi:hypothetical protein C8F01DRAFT_1256721 [Mycena amicta]|nr:hypothetical protein C8F01DRAFT_1256721 [Mycena amicta]